MTRCLNKLALVCTIILSVGAWSARADDAPFAIVGYLPHYRLADVTAAQLRGLTDLIYFGIEPSKDGRVGKSPVSREALSKLLEIKKATKCRLLLCVGGWNRSKDFPALVNDESARKRFIEELAAFCKANHFAGVDYDWEHPKDAAELSLYRTLLADTRDRFQKDALCVTVAQASWQDLGKSAYDLVDRVHLMSYDHDFPQATLGKTTADVQRLLGWACPAGKIALGLPFYGRNAKRASRTYREIVSGGPFDATQDEKQGYAFNGPATITAKTDYALSQGLAGVMIWEVAQDSSKNSTSLLHAIRKRVAEESRRSAPCSCHEEEQ